MNSIPEVMWTQIPLQVGSELRIKNNGDLTLDNPQLELAGDMSAADAVLLYRFDRRSREHIVHLLDPVADQELYRSHRRDEGFKS
jgi:hypothetical protein